MEPAAVLSVLVQANGVLETHRKIEQLDKSMSNTSRSMDRDADKIERALGGVGKQIKRTTDQAERDWRRFASSPERATSSMRRAAAATDDAGDSGRAAAGGLTALGGGFGRLSGTVAASLPILAGASTQLFAVGSALAPIVGLGAGAGNALIAAAQGAGTLALAAMGVGDALKEQITAASTAGATATKMAGQERASAQAIAAAQEGVRTARDAVRDATLRVADAERAQKYAGENLTESIRAARQAQDQLSDARVEAARQLEDLSDKVVDASMAEQRATRDLAEARRALQALGVPDTEKIAQAHEDARDAADNEARAVRGLEQARRDLEKLNGGPDPKDVAAGQEAIDDATRAEQRAIANLDAARSRSETILASSTATDAEKRDAALDLADAEDAVGDAATRRTDAEAALARLNAGPTDNEKAAAAQKVADAQRDVERAQRARALSTKAVADAEAGPSEADKASALADVVEAEQALARATRDRARAQVEAIDAQKKGIAGSDAVVAAHERIRDANQAVRDAQRDVRAAERSTAEARRDLGEASRDVDKALRGVKDAQLDAADAAVVATAATGKLNEKFNDLPPAAQAFVRKLIELKPRLDDLRATAAAGLFPGVTSGIDKAMGSFDAVNTVVGQTATELGSLGDKAGALVGSSGFGRDIETVGGRNAKVLGVVGQAALNLVDALRHVAVAAGPLTDWMARVVLKWSEAAQAAARTGRETGALADFFDKAKERAQLFGSILANTARGIFGLGAASEATGVGILEDLDKLTEKFADWSNSVRGRQEISAFFDRMDAAMRKVWPALAALVGAFVNFSTNVLPAYARILQLLTPVMDELVTIFIAYKFAATAAAIATGIVTVATQAWAGAQWLLNAAMSANPLALVAIAVAALVAAFIIAYKESETFRNIVNSTWTAIKDAAIAVWDFLGPYITGWWKVVSAVVEGYVKTWVAVVTWGWGAIKTVTATVWDAISAYFTTWWTVMSGVVKFWLGAWHTAITGAWTSIREATSAAWDGIKTALSTVFGLIRDSVTFWFGLYRSIIAGVWTGISTAATTAWETIRTGLSTAWSLIRSAADLAWAGVKTAIISPIRETVEWLHDKLGTDGLIGWLAGVWDKLVTGAGGFGGAIKDTLVDAFKGAANLVIGFINAIIDAINVIPGVENIKTIAKLAEGGTFGGTGPKGAPGATARAFAKGGAFARTGGLVDSPITLMGEEAPRHPEFVIPTNPAYRGRAQGLAMQAAKAVGLARGGMYSQSDMEQLWRSQGGGDVKIAGAVGMAESGGDPNAGRSHPYHGLWQVGPGGPFDPIENARAAIAKWRAGGNDVDARWRPWEAYTGPDGVGNDGPFRKFMGGGGGILGDIGNALGGALGAVGGVMGDLLSKGAGFILDKLPNPAEMLPGWLRGMGGHVISGVSGWIKDKVEGLIGIGGGGLPEGVAGSVGKAIELAKGLGFGQPSPGQLTGGKHAAGSLHYEGRAVDFGDAGHTFDQMKTLFNTLASTFGSKLNELFYDKMPWHINAHKKVAGPFGDHGDHIHAGFRKGGLYGGLLGSYASGTPYVPETGPYLLHRGEAVIPAHANQPIMIIVEDGAVDPDKIRVIAHSEANIVVEQRDRAAAARYRAGVLPA